MPKEGINRDEYLNKKFGGKEQALRIYKNIEDEGQLANIYFQFKKIKITPNSFLSHKLLAFAFSKQQQNEVLEAIFFHYFIEGKNIGNLVIDVAGTYRFYSFSYPDLFPVEGDNRPDYDLVRESQLQLQLALIYRF